ncbi:hypothetical protein AN218_30665, partial [Streptomyces nanshensis]
VAAVAAATGVTCAGVPSRGSAALPLHGAFALLGAAGRAVHRRRGERRGRPYGFGNSGATGAAVTVRAARCREERPGGDTA